MYTFQTVILKVIADSISRFSCKRPMRSGGNARKSSSAYLSREISGFLWVSITLKSYFLLYSLRWLLYAVWQRLITEEECLSIILSNQETDQHQEPPKSNLTLLFEEFTYCFSQQELELSFDSLDFTHVTRGNCLSSRPRLAFRLK